MNLRIVKGYLVAVSSGIVLLAALVLLLIQWGNAADFSLYGMNAKPNTGLLMLLSGIGGVMVYLLGRLTVLGIRWILKGRRELAAKQTTERLLNLDKTHQASGE
jgi:hypothetical protein